LELLKAQSESGNGLSSASKSSFLLLVNQLIGHQVQDEEVDLVFPVRTEEDARPLTTRQKLENVIHF
jgi:hypothetical protein